jgi:threonine dehydrogenase-like Zn-dependent dehydrogenase
MHGTLLYGPRDVRFEERPNPTILEPTDAIIRISAACVCGSDLWPYRGIEKVSQPRPMGHEYVGIVEDIGSEVKNVKIGDLELPLEQAAEGYRAMDERRAIKPCCIHKEVLL